MFPSSPFPVFRRFLADLCLAFVLGSASPAAVEPYPLPARSITHEVRGDLVGASGVDRWTKSMSSSASGLQSVKIVDGKIGGPMNSGQAAGFSVTWPAAGADLDLGFRDFLDIDLQVPAGFRGNVAVDFATRDHKPEQPLSRIVLPASALLADGQGHRYRIDVGLVPRWRGFLSRLALVIEPVAGQTAGTVAVGRVLLGDRPGELVEPNLDLNLKPGMNLKDLKKVESKHGCIWWEAAHEKEGFDPDVMPRRALRMLEETWQVAVNQLGYRDPCLGMNPASSRRRKINHITWHGGFWMSGGDPPHFNIQAGGLLDESWGNPLPHEFAHAVQAGQLDFLNGSHWESHANYIRFRRNLHFREFTGLDCIDFGVLLRSNYFQDHPRLIYADYRPYFYLDDDPDKLGFAPGLSAKLWQTGVKDQYLWDRLPSLLPAGVTREQVVAGMARSWVTFAFPAGRHFKETHFGPDQAGRIRWFRYMAPLLPEADRPDWFAVPLAKAPMKFGWCFHEIEATGPVVQAKLEGVDLQGNDEDWRWGFVAIGQDGAVSTSEIFKPGIGSFTLPQGPGRLILFAAATPKNPALSYPRPTPETAVDRFPEHRRYPYAITFRNAKPTARSLPVDRPQGQPHANGGGFVAHTAKVDATAFVGPDARVLGESKVLGHARILDGAVVMESATVSDRAEVSGGTVVLGNATVSDDARVRGFAFVGGNAKVRERARVADLADLQEDQDVAGDAWLRGVTAPLGNSRIGGYAILDADYAMGFTLMDGVHFHHIPWGDWYFDEVAAKLTKPRGLVASYQFKETDGAQALDQFGALVANIRGNPRRRDSALLLDGKGQYLLLDPSLVDSQAATWVIRARFQDNLAQPLFSINDPATGGLVLGLNPQGVLTVALSGGNSPSVVFAAKARIQAGAPLAIGLRLDGKTAALFLNGAVVAEQKWEAPPKAFFHDVTSPDATRIFLGRDAKGAGCRAEILGFSAYNVALTNDEMAAQAAGRPDT